MEKALTECEIFMIIITQASIVSDNVLDEIGYAIDNGKRFLPVLLEKCNVPLRLRRFQYVDFTDKSFDEGVESAKELLRNLISQPTVPQKNPADSLQNTSDQKQKDAVDHPSTETPGASGPATTTANLRREKMEQELRFKAETERLLQEKADLEKKLQEEHDTHERMEAVKKARDGTRPASPGRRSKLIGIFGISILAIAIAGFAAARFLSAPPSVNVPTETPLSIKDTPSVAGATELIPITAKDTSAPALEASTNTEAPADTQTPADAETATPASEFTDEKGAEMVLIPAGDFTMGSNRGEADEQPVHIVSLDAFYIDKYEVTNKLYKECADAGKCEPPKQIYFFAESPNKIYYGVSQYDNYPVIFVDWNMAKSYCEWRGARLPTEAEWEKAARGADGNTYPWGKDLDCQKANYQGCVNRTSEVGVYPQGVSPYGVYDMTGNVWEWVSDWYSNNYYSISPGNNPLGPSTGQSRVLRGGSWPRFDITAYHRNKFAPDYNTFDIGFRCARSQ